MSAITTKTPLTYLKQARLEAGFTNRETAATAVPFSPESLGRHERGEIPVTPEDMIVYAQCYQREDILFRYCADCPIGRETGRTATDRDLPFATVRLTNRLRQAAEEITSTLEAIADDGIVDNDERPVFNAALASLRDLGESITDIILYAASQGIKIKPRPVQRVAAHRKTIN